MRRVYHAIAYYVTLLLFGLFGLAANVACLAVGWIPPLRGNERAFQRAIHRLFRLFLWWMRTIRVCRVEFRGELRRPAHGGLILVANHPGLMDAVYLLARVPDTICIFKPAIRRNPVLGAASRCAGYLSSDAGIDLVRLAAEKVAAGASLIVFPEGTRTPPRTAIGAFKPGFAAIAQRAAAPLQLVHISVSTDLLARDWKWWEPPSDLPAKVVIEFGPQVVPAAGRAAAELVASTLTWFEQRALARRGAADDTSPDATGEVVEA